MLIRSAFSVLLFFTSVSAFADVLPLGFHCTLLSNQESQGSFTADKMTIYYNYFESGNEKPAVMIAKSNSGGRIATNATYTMTESGRQIIHTVTENSSSNSQYKLVLTQNINPNNPAGNTTLNISSSKESWKYSCKGARDLDPADL